MKNPSIKPTKRIIPAASFKHLDIGFVTPARCLQKFVQSIWVIDTTKVPLPATQREKFYPDAGTSLTSLLMLPNVKQSGFITLKPALCPGNCAADKLA